MHAFLINSTSTESINDLGAKLNATILEFPLSKIEDTKNLNNFLRLTIDKKTLIVIKEIEKASIESLNAFLKNLEEPQENIYFCLTTNNVSSVLPTIVSRCQIIKDNKNNYQIKNEEQINNFLEGDTNKRLLIVEKIKERSDAIDFLNDLIYFDHQRNNFNFQDCYLETLKNLKLNGNVALQLVNLVVRMGNANGK